MSCLLLGAYPLLLATVTAGADLPQAPAPRAAGAEVAERLPRGQKFAEQGRVDMFVAATAVWDLKPDDDRLWVPAVDLGRRLIAKAGLKGDRKPKHCPSSYRDFATYERLYSPRFTRVDEHYTCPDAQKANPPVLYYNAAIQAAGVDSSTGLTNNLIVSRGHVRTEKGIHSSVIVANGDVTSRGVMAGCVVICDGDVTIIDRGVSQCLVIARGNITLADHAQESTLIAGGKVTIRERRKLPDEKFEPFIKENEPNPLGYVTFFELSRIGLEVKAADKVVTVAKVTAGSAGAKAGLKVGDVVLEVNGKKPADAESLRRLLRDALAVGDAALKLQRGDRTETTKVSLDG